MLALMLMFESKQMRAEQPSKLTNIKLLDRNRHAAGVACHSCGASLQDSHRKARFEFHAVSQLVSDNGRASLHASVCVLHLYLKQSLSVAYVHNLKGSAVSLALQTVQMGFGFSR